MAVTPENKLIFHPPDQTNCFRCAERVTQLPSTLPPVGDDFDWRVRDFDGFRQFMMEDLAARFPERKRWTPADIEVVIVEALAAQLDQLSDSADRVFAEGFIETARNPASLRKLLSLVGYDSVAMAHAQEQIEIDGTMTVAEQNDVLENFWETNPFSMETARRAGPQQIRTQHRMVSIGDYAERLEDHPLVLRAKSTMRWTGSWSSMFIALILWNDQKHLDDLLPQLGSDPNSEQFRLISRLRADINRFNRERRIPIPDWNQPQTPRSILRAYVNQYRQVGQEVFLDDAIPVGITIVASINVSHNYFASEVKMAALSALGRGVGGYFEPGRLRFGEDIFASDIIATLMSLDGVDNVCLIRFKRTGAEFPDETASGRIILDGLEIAVCDNDPATIQIGRGYVTLQMNGGLGA